MLSWPGQFELHIRSGDSKEFRNPPTVLALPYQMYSDSPPIPFAMFDPQQPPHRVYVRLGWPPLSPVQILLYLIRWSCCEESLYTTSVPTSAHHAMNTVLRVCACRLGHMNVQIILYVIRWSCCEESLYTTSVGVFYHEVQATAHYDRHALAVCFPGPGNLNCI